MSSHPAIEQAITRAAWELAARREHILRDAARERLPRPLRWAPDHPRALRLIYRLRPAWAPTIIYGTDLGTLVPTVVMLDGTVVIVDAFDLGERTR